MDIKEELSKLSAYDIQNMLEMRKIWWWVKRVLIGIGAIIVLLMGGCPHYEVWQQEMSGRAELSRASQNRQIAIQEAQALKESAQLKADAEAIRATGVKQANETIAGSMGGAEGYLRYLYIDALQSSNCQTIYVPTEAGLPILEAGRK